MKYYTVVSKYYDTGRTQAFLYGPEEADTMPTDYSESRRNCDVYVDHFKTRAAAAEHVNGVKNA